MRRLFYLIQKESRQIRRRRANIILVFVAPFLQLLIIGSSVTTEVKNVPMGVVDYDHSPASRLLIQTFAASGSFHFLGVSASEGQAVELLDNGRVKLMVIIPPGLERDMKNGRAPRVQVLLDGVDGNSAGVALGYVTALLAQLQRGWATGRYGPAAGPAAAPVASAAAGPAAGPGRARVTVSARMWYNPNLDSKLNFVPGLIGILLIIVTTFLTSVNIVREKEIGTLEQLMVTPLTRAQIILGKIIPFGFLSFLQLTMSILAAGLVFGIWMKGSPLLLYAMAGLFFLSTLGLGIFISTLVRTQQQAMFVSWFATIYTMLLSGFFIPIANMPVAIQYITYLNPLRYFITVLREVYLKGTGIRFLWREALAMGVIGTLALVSASLRFHKRLK
jgi:ABC-2 type transport system permease protein